MATAPVGTIVEGVVVINGTNPAFLPHGSSGITLKDMIAKNITGDAYWWNLPGTNSQCVNDVGCGTIDNSNDVITPIPRGGANLLYQVYASRSGGILTRTRPRQATPQTGRIRNAPRKLDLASL